MGSPEVRTLVLGRVRAELDLVKPLGSPGGKTADMTNRRVALLNQMFLGESPRRNRGPRVLRIRDL